MVTGLSISIASRKENAICLYALLYEKIVRAMRRAAHRPLCLHPKGKTTQRSILLVQRISKTDGGYNWLPDSTNP